MRVKPMLLGMLLGTCALACRPREFNNANVQSSVGNQPGTALDWCLAFRAGKTTMAQENTENSILNFIYPAHNQTKECKSFVPYLEKATYLTIHNRGIRDLGPFVGLSSLESLSLRTNDIKGEDLAPLSRLPKLRWLWLHGNKVSKTDCAQVPQVPADQCFTDDQPAAPDRGASMVGLGAEKLLPIGSSVEPERGRTQSYQDELGLAHACQFKLELKGDKLVTTNFNTQTTDPSSGRLSGPDEIDFGPLNAVRIVKVKTFPFMGKQHVFVKAEGPSHVLFVVYEEATKKLILARRNRKLLGIGSQFFCGDKAYTLSSGVSLEIWSDDGRFAVSALGGESK